MMVFADHARAWMRELLVEVNLIVAACQLEPMWCLMKLQVHHLLNLRLAAAESHAGVATMLSGYPPASLSGGPCAEDIRNGLRGLLPVKEVCDMELGLC